MEAAEMMNFLKATLGHQGSGYIYIIDSFQVLAQKMRFTYPLMCIFKLTIKKNSMPPSKIDVPLKTECPL